MPNTQPKHVSFFHSIPSKDRNEGELLYLENHSKDSVHFGGIYHSFFPHNIEQLTGINQYGLSGDFPSDSTIKVWLHQANHQKSILAEFNNCKEIEFSLPQFEILAGQRLTLEIFSNNADQHQLKNIPFSWDILITADQLEKQKKINLAIVICTYNNEELVRDNVKKLTQSTIWNSIPAELIVVNNGGLDNELEFPFPRVTQFKQINSGGSGGFYRGVDEAVYQSLAHKDYSHILLMDDDVEFHPEVIQRLTHIHQFSLQDNVIGASMLNLEQPDILHEAGANYPVKTSIRGTSAVSMGKIDQDKLVQLGVNQQVHYNAWWFCSFSVNAVKKVGMPLRVFIRGDDSEYGLRLRHHGFPTYCPGGISLWHASFETKPRTWIQYFNFRNNIIRLLTQQGDMKNKPSIAKTQLTRLVKRNIIKNDYGAAAMALRAYEDLLKNNFSWEIECYKTKITELTKEYSYYSATEAQKVSHTKEKGRRRPRRWWKRPITLLKYATMNLTVLPIPTLRTHYVRDTRISWWNTPIFAHIVIESLDEEIIYKRNSKFARQLLKRLSKIPTLSSKSIQCLTEKYASSVQGSAEQ